jgi:hypothetical protein
VASFASSLRGEPRATNDIDVIVAMLPHRVHAFAEQLGPDFEVDRDMLRDALTRGGCANIFYLPMVTKIDLFALGPSRYDEVEFGRRRKVRVRADGAELFVKTRLRACLLVERRALGATALVDVGARCGVERRARPDERRSGGRLHLLHGGPYRTEIRVAEHGVHREDALDDRLERGAHRDPRREAPGRSASSVGAILLCNDGRLRARWGDDGASPMRGCIASLMDGGWLHGKGCKESLGLVCRR